MKKRIDRLAIKGFKSIKDLSSFPLGDINENSLGDMVGTVLDTDTLSGLKSGLNETDSKLMGFIQSNPSVTIQELQEMLNLSRNGVRKALGRLKATGWFRRVGPDKGGHWEVLER